MKGERLPLEAVTMVLVKIQLTENIVCCLMKCRVSEIGIVLESVVVWSFLRVQ